MVYECVTVSCVVAVLDVEVVYECVTVSCVGCSAGCRGGL